MDDEIRKKIAYELQLVPDQEFFGIYCQEHEKVFGEEWELVKKNP